MKQKESKLKWEDAIKVTLSHEPWSFSKESLTAIGMTALVSDGIQRTIVLSVKVGRLKSTVVYSEEAYLEHQRQISMIPGTKVKMTGAEAEIENLKEKIFEVISGPSLICGDLCVWLKDYSGCYCCEFLEIVE